jgi:hypothetical protein
MRHAGRAATAFGSISIDAPRVEFGILVRAEA